MTPPPWAAHGDRRRALDLLARHTREIWTLWWLPDDEDKALQIVELLLAHGADPSRKNKKGRTAADWARRRGMFGAAARLEAAAGERPT